MLTHYTLNLHRTILQSTCRQNTKIRYQRKWVTVLKLLYNPIPDGSGDGSSHRDSHDDVDDSYECPAVVVYIINPFSYAAHDWDDLNRLAIIGLLRCYREVISMLPENMKNNIYLQVST